jgi:cytochrome c
MDDAKAMALKAATHYRQSGQAAAFTDFAQTQGWRDRDLYVFAVNNAGVTTFNAANPALVGRNMIELKDVDGKPFIREFVSVKDQAWVDYKWRNPQSNTVELKSSYIVRVSDDTIVGVGAYKK